MSRRRIAYLCFFIAVLAIAGAVSVWHQQQRLHRGNQVPVAGQQGRPASIVGINTELFGASDLAIDDAFQTLDALGFKWVRQPMSWAALEPAPGEFDWQLSDQFFQHAASYPLNILVVLEDSPAWAADHPTAPPSNVEDFERFAAAFSERYAEQVEAYQIWDEPNLQAGWGDQDPSAIEYTQLLRAGYLGIKSNTPDTLVLLAGLAPTVERGPKNYSDILYLDKLYNAGAADYFDAVAAKPYGFDTGPFDRRVDANLLNFSRPILLRDVMLEHGDGQKLIWGVNFGWNSLPSDWQGAPSIWGAATETEQAQRIVGAYDRVRKEWAWSGVMFLETYQPDATLDNARWGFALVAPNGDYTPAARAMRTYLDTVAESAKLTEQTGVADHLAYSGIVPADSTIIQYEGDWKLSDLGGDVPAVGEGDLALPFYGTDIGVVLRRDNYRGYLYVSIDGKPAPNLPLDQEGRAYVVMTSGDYLPTTELVWLGQGLAPGPHLLEIHAERSWRQFAIVAFQVLNAPIESSTVPPIARLLGLVGVVSLVLFVQQAWGQDILAPVRHLFQKLSDRLQFLTASGVTAVMWLSAWLAWGENLTHAVRRYGDTWPLVITALTAGVFYLSTWVWLTVLSVFVLFIILYLRPDFIVPLVAVLAPFYLIPRPLFDRLFSLVELVTLMGVVAVSLHLLAHWRENKFRLRWPTLIWLDWAVIGFAITAAISAFLAERQNLAITELRMMVVEPVLLYFILRVVKFDRRALQRTIMLWLLGGLIVAVIGIYHRATGTNLIQVGAGVARVRSIYGSPNNVGLYLGRLYPIALALGLILKDRTRWLYLGVAGILLTTILLSISRGALLLGIPAATAIVILLWQGKRARRILLGLGVLGMLALIPVSRLPRFADLLNRASGPTFFRLNLWRSTLQMIRENPWTGVGLDNFLYAYRGRYIAPQAWQDPDLSHAHNWILDFASRIGIPGLLMVLLLLGLIVFMLWQGASQTQNLYQRAIMIGLLGSVADFAAHGLVDASYWFVDLAFAFMLTAGLSWIFTNAYPADDTISQKHSVLRFMPERTDIS